MPKKSELCDMTEHLDKDFKECMITYIRYRLSIQKFFLKTMTAAGISCNQLYKLGGMQKATFDKNFVNGIASMDMCCRLSDLITFILEDIDMERNDTRSKNEPKSCLTIDFRNKLTELTIRKEFEHLNCSIDITKALYTNNHRKRLKEELVNLAYEEKLLPLENLVDKNHTRMNAINKKGLKK